MVLFLVSFLAGVLTVLAPCILPLLPVIVGGAAAGPKKRNAYVITASLALSVVLFTLLLKATTAFIAIPQSFWAAFAGGIIIAFGLVSLFPQAWEKVNIKLGLQKNSDELMEKSAKRSGRFGDILLGASLGPVFSSCSPTYFVILGVVLPQSFALGTIYLLAYAAGLASVLLAIALLGQRFVKKVRWAADPQGWFKKGLGVLFILVGIFILTGADKDLEAFLLDQGYYNPTFLEDSILDRVDV